MGRELRRCPWVTRWLSKVDPVWLLVVAGICAYTIVLSRLSLQRVELFQTGVTDLGHFDNYMWRLSRGLSNYSTTVMYRGMSGHTYGIMYAFLPLYWFFDGLKAVLIAQSFLVALGGVAVYLLGKWALRSRGAAVAFSLLYLSYGPLHFATLDDFHTEVLGIPLMLFAAYFIETRRFSLVVAVAGLSLLCKETYALTLVGLSLLLLLKREWKVAAVLTILSLVWWLAVRRFVGGYGRHGVPEWGSSFVGEMGTSEAEALVFLATHPGHIVSRYLEPQSRLYLSQLMGPVLGLCLLAPQWLIPALPVLTFNVVSEWLPTRIIIFRYTAPIIPFIWVATVHSAAFLSVRIERFGRKVGQGLGAVRWDFVAQGFVPGLLLTLALLMYLGGTPSRPSDPAVQKSDEVHRSAMRRALALVPAHASVSAQYYFVPHLSHREKVYWFPMPFWRFQREHPEYMCQLEPFDEALFDARLSRARLDYVLVDEKGFADTKRLPASFRVPMEPAGLLKAVERLRVSSDYEPVFSEDGVTLFRREHGSAR